MPMQRKLRVGLVSTWGVRCGHAEFASNLVDSMPDIEFQPIPDTTDAGMMAAVGNGVFDLLHIIWGGDQNISVEAVHWVQERGVKVVLSNQVTKPHGDSHPLMSAVNRVITTEPTSNGKFTYIPMGIPDGWVAEQPPENMAGTIGFPFRWKGIPDLAAAASLAGMGFLGILPDYDKTVNENHEVRQAIMKVHESPELLTGWLSKEETKNQLGRCSVQIFAHRPYPWTAYGVSSACRYGLATGRPCVFNRFEMYRDLFPYEDELWFVEPEKDDIGGLAEMLIQAAAGTKKPKRLLEDMSWAKCGQRFKQVYEEVLA